ncbi:unnamed protein product [Discula destructiva]
MGDHPEDDALIGFGGQPSKRKVVHDPDYNEAKGQFEDEDETMRDVLDEEEDEDEDDEDPHGPLNPAKRRRLQRLKNAPRPGTRRSGRNPSEQRPVYKQPLLTFDDEDDEEDQDFDFGSRGRRKTLRKKGSMQQLDDEADELGGDPEELLIVRSDVVPQKRPRKGRSLVGKRRAGRHGDEDDPEEAPRRSGRANQSNKSMYLDDNLDEEMYAPEEEKLPAIPKVSGAKEVFPRVLDGPFKHAHSTTCGTCGNNADAPNKGMMIYCQGCSNAYHKICLGFRTTRDHIVTKVGPFQFVLQCRDCVGSKRKKDGRSPDLGVCQVCWVKGRACEAFAHKLPAATEAKLREENEGEDPIHRVDHSLINNPENVLFRCTNCHCAYHFEHLPPIGGKNTEGSVRDDRIESYSVDWKCKACLDMRYKVSTLVAWRPTDRNKYLSKTALEVPEDAKEYLVKWDSRSYAHCDWRSGPWVFGVTNAVMRNAFPKRNNGQNLYPRFDEKEAIPEEYLLADVVLNVTFRGKFHFESKKKDLKKIHQIEQAMIKFQGLDYSEVVWDEPPPPDSGSRWKAFVTAYSEFLNGKHFRSEPTSKIKERLRELRKMDFEEEIEFDTKDPARREQPEGLTGQLMKYQIQGLNWLLNNFHQQRSVVLADEMGLGKTIQVISLFAALANNGMGLWPFLVVVPNSTCPNWRREIKQWAPDLRVVAYHGGREPQKLAYQHELFPNGTREMKAHVVIMSYDSAQDPETRSLFRSIQWIGLVVDEGQRLKNDENILYGALTAMRIPWRLLLTGTPLQNNKRELFNLIQFIDPSKNAAQLDEKYEDITAENISELHELIRPYFLRRTKAGPTGVLKFLPPMSQIILPVTMSVVQQKLCKSIMAKNPELIRAIFAKTKLKSNERSSLNNILMQLRKCLCHPFLYSGAVEERDVSDETLHQNLVSASSKLVLLEQMLPKLKERGHRVLIFTQFLGMLDIIEDFLTGMGLMFQRLDGTISSLEKQKRIDAFNEPQSEYFAFLLSTRAGGVGINLATADTVIILDPDFNPHQDMQALSRAHRIGQKHKVLCFQLMTKTSVEEKIMQIGRKKMALDHALIESMDRKEDDPGEDLESILKHGAEALFSDSNDDQEVIKYDAEAIDKLLDRSQIKNPEYPDGETGEKASEKQFAFAQVWENKTGGLANDLQVEDSPNLDLSVWDKILEEREAEAKRLAELNKEVLGRGSRRRQAVKYNGQGPAIAGVDDAGDAVGGSDVDEDFISDETSDDDTEGDASNSLGNLGMGGKRKKASTKTVKTPKKPAPRKSANKTNAPHPQSTPKADSSVPRKIQTPRKSQATPKQMSRSGSTAGKNSSQLSCPDSQVSSPSSRQSNLNPQSRSLAVGQGKILKAQPRNQESQASTSPPRIHPIEQKSRPVAHEPETSLSKISPPPQVALDTSQVKSRSSPTQMDSSLSTVVTPSPMLPPSVLSDVSTPKPSEE